MTTSSWSEALTRALASSEFHSRSAGGGGGPESDWLTTIALAMKRFTSVSAPVHVTTASVARDLAASPSAAPTRSPQQQCVRSPTISLCQPPLLYNNGKGVGRGECWLGANRIPGTAITDPITWKTVAGVSSALAYANFESGLGVYNATLGTFLNPGAGKTIPSCLAMWAYSTPGKWVMDSCAKTMPSVCVRDAHCPSSYYKTAPYQVDASGAVNPGVCVLCPSGQYRNTSQDESLCLDCLPGYYGNASASNRVTEQCSGVCPRGTYCTGGSGAPIQCLPGTYGVNLTDPVHGPGWTSYAQACTACSPGAYCDTSGNTSPTQHLCAAGRCGYAGQTDASCAAPCPEGYYCPAGSACPDAPWAPGLSFAHACGDGALGAAYPSGAAAYCPSGSQAPVAVVPGYYGAGGVNASYNAYELQCSAGSFCVNGTQTPCSNGTYTSQPAQAACAACTAGYFCPKGSTFATQQLCAPTNAANPAQYYCPSGTLSPLLVVDSSLMTLPATTAALYTRQSVQACPSNKVCVLGIALDRIVWTGACTSDGTSTVDIPELYASQGSGVFGTVSMQAPLVSSDFNVTYSLSNQTFVGATLCPTTCNDGIFDINSTTGEILLLRHSPDPYNGSAALQFETCPPDTDIRYTVTLSATAVNKSNANSETQSTCTLTIGVLDVNDQPIFPRPITNPTGAQRRFILDSSPDNIPALRCTAQSATLAGCAADTLTTPEVVATDEDEFGHGNLYYSFVGPLTAVQNKLKINICTGLISANGLGPTWNELPPYDGPGIYRKITYTVMAMDDGKYGKFAPLNNTIEVDVYVQNINHAPVLQPVTFFIQELLPAGTPLTPPVPNFTDVDVGQTHTFSIVQNDASAFAIVNNTVVTTLLGAQQISFHTAKKQYTIELAVTDNGSPPLSSQLTYTVQVTDNNVAPVIDTSSLVFYVSELASVGAPVCHAQSGVCGADSPVTSTDVNVVIDGITSDVTTYSLDNSAQGRFAIDAHTGIIYVNRSGAAISFLDPANNLPVGGTGRGFALLVRATSDGNGTCPNPQPASTVATAYVYLVHENHAPFFYATDVLTLVETAPIGSAVAVINASDPDNSIGFVFGVQYSLQALTVTIVPNGLAQDGSSEFHMSTTGGNPTLLVSNTLSYAGAPVCDGGVRCYIVTVTVTDNGNPPLNASTNVQLNVLPVNHAPVLPSGLSVNISEGVNYVTATDLSDTVFAATDVDAGDVALLSYRIVGGSGTSAFTIVVLDGGAGFYVRKLPNVLLNFEATALYTLLVTASDDGPAKTIGAECALLSAASDCGAGAVCDPVLLRCMEKCVSATDPRVNTFFCVDAAVYNETATTTVSINILDANDAPFVVYSPLYPVPNVITNANCSLTGAVAFDLIRGNLAQDQVAIKPLTLWDDDVNVVHRVFMPDWGEPLTVYALPQVPGDLWSIGFVVDAYSGAVTLPANTDNVFIGQTWNGTITVMDWSLAQSQCFVSVRVLESTIVPDLGGNRYGDAIVEETPPDGQVLFSFGPLYLIDPLVLNDPPEVLTFFMSASPYFSINTVSGDITRIATVDYESLASVNFTLQAQVLVRDSQGNTAGATISFPVIDVLEKPYWAQTPVQLSMDELVAVGTRSESLLDFARITNIYSTNASWTTLTFSLQSGSGPYALDVDALISTGALVFPAQYSFVVRAQLVAGPYADADVFVTILEVEQPPVIAAGVVISVPEGESGQTLFDLNPYVTDVNTWDTPTRQKLAISIIDGDPTGIFSVNNAYLVVSGQAVLDYEDVSEYNLTLQAVDTRGMSATGVVMVNVMNVDDVTISSIQLASASYAACDGTTASQVQIAGSNFGMVAQSKPAVFTLAYSRAGGSVVHQTTNCTALYGTNRWLACWITGTVGINLNFTLTVDVPGTQIVADQANATSSISFSPPVLTSMSVSGSQQRYLNTSGGDTVVLHGHCLGAPSDGLTYAASTGADSFVQVLTTGYGWRFVSNCSSLYANGTRVTCAAASPVGLGTLVQWQIKVARSAVSPVLTSGAFAAPSIAAVTSALTNASYGPLATSGVLPNGAIDVWGDNFAGAGASPDFVYLEYWPASVAAPYRFSVLGCVVIDSYQRMRCSSTDPGAGAGLNLTVSFGAQLSAHVPAATMSFAPAALDAFSGEGAKAALTLGSQLVFISGTGFGPQCGQSGTDAASAINCDFIAASYTRGAVDVNGHALVYRPQFCAVVSQTQVSCTTVPGTGAELVWTVVVGSQLALSGPDLGTTSYASPVIGTYESGNHVALQPFRTRGNEVLIIQGSFFGPVGGAPVTAFYGPPSSPLEFNATGCLVTLADTEIQCMTAPGAGSELSWTVLLDGQYSRAELTNYGAPVLYNITRADGSEPLELNDEGGDALVLTGINFGRNSSAPGGAFLESVTYGPPAYIAGIVATQACTVYNHTRILCTALPGVGQNLTWQVRVRGQSSATEDAPTTSYVALEAFAMAANMTTMVACANATAGGSRCIIRARGVGVCAGAQVHVVFGSLVQSIDRVSNNGVAMATAGCPYPALSLDRDVEFFVPQFDGLAGTPPLSVGVRVSSPLLANGGQVDAPQTFAFTYASPSIDQVYAEPAAGNSITVTFAGSNFCASELCCQTMFVYVDDDNVTVTQPAVVSSHTHDSIVFLAPGVGSGYVTCPGTGTTAVEPFSQHNPFVFGATLQTSPIDGNIGDVEFDTEGGTLIYIFGAFFGPEPSVTIGGQSVDIIDKETPLCGAVGVFPPTITTLVAQPPLSTCYQLLVAVPPGQGVMLPVVVTSGSLNSLPKDTRFEFVNYGAPSITGLGSSFSDSNPTSGSDAVLLEVFGVDFGLSGKIVFGAAGGPYEISCSPQGPSVTGPGWGHRRVACFLPPGDGQNLAVTVISASRQSQPFGALNYAQAQPTAYQLLNAADAFLGDTRGNQTLVLTGTNFGRASQPDGPFVAIGSQPCTVVRVDVSLASANAIYCLTPAGEGANLALTLHSAGVDTTLTQQPFSYGGPRITQMTPMTARTDALTAAVNGTQVMLHLSGYNFGVNELKVELLTPYGALVLGQRNIQLQASVNDFAGQNGSSANHTDIIIALKPYFGGNLTVRVIVAGQSNDNSTVFNYEAPMVTTLNGKPIVTIAHNGRRRADNAVLGGFAWGPPVASRDDLPCRFVLRNATVSAAYKEWVNVSADGTLSRLVDVYNASANSSCAPADFLGTASIDGTWDDLGPHPVLPCMRVYHEVVASATGQPLPAGLSAGGYGVYLIAAGTDGYFSHADYGSVSALNSSSLTPDVYDDAPTVVMIDPVVSDNIAIPSSGCQFWEELTDYLARVQLAPPGAELPRKCLSPVLIEIQGANFGDDSVPGSLRVWLVDEDNDIAYEASTTGTSGNHGLLCTTDVGCVHTDTLIVFMAPIGAGRGLTIRLLVGNLLYESAPAVDYIAPQPTSLDPGTVLAGNNFLSSVGSQAMQVFGAGMGYATSPLAVYLNVRPCGSLQWQDGTVSIDGEPSLACSTPQDVAGIRSVFVCVGGQGYMTSARREGDVQALQAGQLRGAWNSSAAPDAADGKNVQALAVALCPNNTYGNIGELCIPCPVGAQCGPGLALPVADPGFALLAFDATSTLAQNGYCAPQRIDPAFQANFSRLVQQPVCYGVAACTPADSCLGGNQCETGYQYELYNCLSQRANMGANQTCSVARDPFTGLWRGNDQDCRANVLQPGQACSTANPTDCSSCHVYFADDAGDGAYGLCECDMPPRCSLCTSFEYYRLNNKCVPCPQNPGLILALFVMAAVGLIFLGYWLQKKNVNLGFLSVTVDYFQVLGVLSTTNVPWPPVILSVFEFFQVFLASIDIAAPECLISNLEFPAKFYFTETMPFMALGVLIAAHLFYTVRKVYTYGKRVKWLSHVGRLVGIYILIVYILYLSLTKYALEVFDCNPLNPDDGYEYTTFSSLQCDGGGLCRCGEPGGLQQSLVPPAIGFLLLYSVGFPLVVASILWTNRREIEEDQYLRAYGLGWRHEANVRAWTVRKKYKLIYMYYKPEYHFWMLAVLARKFFIAFAALMFRGNASFQLATILIVLFVCFTVQVKNRPYMSTGEYPLVVHRLNQRSKMALEDSSMLHYRDLVRKVAESQEATTRITRSETAVRTKALGNEYWDTVANLKRDKEERSRVQRYFFDLNAVEAILLGSITVISLSGIMFESGQFTSRPDLYWTGEMTTIIVFVLLFSTLVYTVAVFVNEFAPMTFARYFGRFIMRFNDDHAKDVDQLITEAGVEMDANPLFKAAKKQSDGADGRNAVLEKELEEANMALRKAREHHAELVREASTQPESGDE